MLDCTERLDNFRIELGSAPGNYLGSGLGMTKPALVRPLLPQGGIDIANSRDPASQTDFLTSLAKWVPVTIPMLVVIERDFSRKLELT